MMERFPRHRHGANHQLVIATKLLNFTGTAYQTTQGWKNIVIYGTVTSSNEPKTSRGDLKQGLSDG